MSLFSKKPDEQARLAQEAKQKRIDDDIRRADPRNALPPPQLVEEDPWIVTHRGICGERHAPINGPALKTILEIERKEYATKAELAALKALDVRWRKNYDEQTKLGSDFFRQEMIRQASIDASEIADETTRHFVTREQLDHHRVVARGALNRAQKVICREAMILWLPVLQRLERVVRVYCDKLAESESKLCVQFGLPFQPSPVLRLCAELGAYSIQGYIKQRRGEIGPAPSELLFKTFSF